MDKNKIISIGRNVVPLVVIALAGTALADSPVNFGTIANEAKATIAQAGAVAGGVVASGVAIRIAVKWGKAIAGMA